jgi:hypothetical protein
MKLVARIPANLANFLVYSWMPFDARGARRLYFRVEQSFWESFWGPFWEPFWEP